MKVISIVKNIQSTIPKIQNNNYGVSLLELMVAVALFAITIVLATSIFQSIINSQRTAVAAEDLQENMRYGFERMGKEVRTAQKDTPQADKNFPCIPSGSVYWTSASGDQLEFLNYHGQCVKYFASSTQLYVSYPNSSDNTLKNGLPLTARELKISNLIFKVIDNNPNNQALVTVKMLIQYFIKGSPAQAINMETSLSSRFYE